MSLTNSHGIAAFDFKNLSGCTQLIKKLTYKLDNFLDLILTDVPCVLDLLIDPPLGKSDHFSISLSVKMGFEISSI